MKMKLLNKSAVHSKYNRCKRGQQSVENEMSYSGQWDMTTYFANYWKHDWKRL